MENEQPKHDFVKRGLKVGMCSGISRIHSRDSCEELGLVSMVCVSSSTESINSPDTPLSDGSVADSSQTWPTHQRLPDVPLSPTSRVHLFIFQDFLKYYGKAGKNTEQLEVGTKSIENGQQPFVLSVTTLLFL